MPKYDKVGGGSFGVYKKRKDSNVWVWVGGILVVLFLIGIAA
jgi:hypothetical protein